jgi:hypothetical protein
MSRDGFFIVLRKTTDYTVRPKGRDSAERRDVVKDALAKGGISQIFHRKDPPKGEVSPKADAKNFHSPLSPFSRNAPLTAAVKSGGRTARICRVHGEKFAASASLI